MGINMSRNSSCMLKPFVTRHMKLTCMGLNKGTYAEADYMKCAFSSKDDVSVWLKCLHLEAYEALFASAGYRNKDDLESLKLLKSDDLKKLGITKKGNTPHLTTFVQ